MAIDYDIFPVRRDAVYGCIRWTGEHDRDGYGRHGRDLAHLAIWRLARGALPAHRELDHLCRRRDCVRLTHLEIVTRSQNLRRRSWRSRVRRRYCPGGHLYYENGRRTPEGGIVCRVCDGTREVT